MQEKRRHLVNLAGDYQEDVAWTQQISVGWNLDVVLEVLERAKAHFGMDK